MRPSADDPERMFCSRPMFGGVTLLIAGHHDRPAPGHWRHVVAKPQFMLHYVYRGSGTVMFPDSVHDVGPGTWFFYFPGQDILYKPVPESPWLYYYVDFIGERVADAFAAQGVTADTHVLRDSGLRATVRAFDGLLASMDADVGRTGSGFMPHARFLEVLDRMTAAAAAAGLSPSVTQNAYVEEAKRFMSLNCHRPITASEVAAHAGYDRAYFSRLFKRATGSSLRDYLDELRMAHAKQLLKTTDMTIDAVSAAVGYIDRSAFQRRFKRETGRAPGAFRRSPNPNG